MIRDFGSSSKPTESSLTVGLPPFFLLISERNKRDIENRVFPTFFIIVFNGIKIERLELLPSKILRLRIHEIFKSKEHRGREIRVHSNHDKEVQRILYLPGSWSRKVWTFASRASNSRCCCSFSICILSACRSSNKAW